MNSTDLPGPADVGITGRWRLPLAGGPVIGRFLGMSSSQRTGHNDRVPHPGGFASAGDQCQTCRWTEIRIFRTDDGWYVIHRAGHSIVPDELSRYQFTRVRTAYEVVESLTSRTNGVASLHRRPAMALAQAAAYDVPLRDAYENRAVS